MHWIDITFVALLSACLGVCVLMYPEYVGAHDRLPGWYGIDAPEVQRLLLTIALVASVLAWMLRWWGRRLPLLIFWPLLLLSIFVAVSVAAVAAMLLHGSLIGKFEMAETVLAEAGPWSGTERVLDIGCGHGLLLCSVGRRLLAAQEGHHVADSTKQVYCADIWSERDQSDNSPLAALENARLNEIESMVEIVTADARQLPFPDASFDRVVSSLAIHNINEREFDSASKAERARAINEAVRVLRPGGTFVTWDIFSTEEYVETLRAHADVDHASVSHLGPYDVFRPSFIVKATKRAV